MRDTKVDMLHGPLAGKLFWFALPIAASSMLQQLFNAADTAVVGKFADAAALAAVGTNGEIVAFIVSLSAGLAVGTNVLLGMCIGKGEKKDIQGVIQTAMVLALAVGLVGLLLGQVVARPILVLIHTPEEILDLAVQYLRIYCLGYPALLVYDFGSAILRSKGDSRRPFLILTFSGFINVGLNLFFVIVCGLGVAGVAVATDLSTLFSAGMVVWWLIRETDEIRLSVESFCFSGKFVGKIVSIGLPAGLQGAVFCLANIFIQSAVNSFGSIAVAGSAISMNYEYFSYYILSACGQAATTFVSQNYAAGNRQRCRRILVLCLVGSVLFDSIVNTPLVIWRQAFSGIFSSETAVLEAACQRMLIVLALGPVCGLYEVPAGVMRGMGYSLRPALMTMLGICLFRIVWVETVFRRVRTLPCLFIVFPITWAITLVLIWGTFRLVAWDKLKGNEESAA